MNQKDLVLDFNLYLCERYGYKDSCHVSPTENGCCICVRERDIKFYIRFWEYSNGVNAFPDWCVIIVSCEFSGEQKDKLFDLVQFLKEYAPQYGFKHLAVEDDFSNIGETLGLKRIDSPRYIKNYLAKLDEIEV